LVAGQEELMRLVRLKVVAGVAALAAMSIVAAGASWAQMPSPQQLKQTCVRAGLAKPRDMKVHFWLDVREHSTGPHGGIGYKLGEMPESCSGYRRILFTNIRFKATDKPWRTFHAFGTTINVDQTEKATAWIPTYNRNEATGTSRFDKTPTEIFSEFGSPESTKSQSAWGKLRQVKSRLRVWVEDLQTEKIVGHKLYPVHTKFCRNLVLYGNYACAF
jgi:hypothetical protein